MANTVLSPPFTAAQLQSAQSLYSGRIDVATIRGDTQIDAPTTATDGFAFHRLNNAIISCLVGSGTVIVTPWVGFASDLDPSIILWNIAPGSGALSLDAEGGWLFPAGCPDRIAVQVVIDAGSPEFAINLGGFQ